MVGLSAEATDDVGIAAVEYLVDGAAAASDGASPFTVPWDSRTVDNGLHVIQARARDAGGNTTTSAPVSVVVQNTDAVFSFAAAGDHGANSLTAASVSALDRSGSPSTWASAISTTTKRRRTRHGAST